MTEHQLGKALMDWVRYNRGRYPCLEEFRHIPNEGKRIPHKAYEIGIKAGILDYQMLVPTKYGQGEVPSYFGFCLEIKDTGKEPTQAQEREMQVLRKNGLFAGWTDNLAKAIEIVEGYCKMVHR